MTPGRKRQFDRKEVVEKAAAVFWKQGYEATGMTELVEQLGIGRQSLYNTFGDKRALYLETLQFYFDGRVELAQKIISKPGPHLERLGELLLAIVEVDSACNHPGCLLGNTMAEFGARDPEVEQTVGRFLNQFRGIMQNLLEDARTAGELERQRSPADLARSLLVMSQGLLLANQNKLLRDSGVEAAVLRTVAAMLNPPDPKRPG